MADEKVNVQITTDYDDKEAKAAIKDAEKIEKLDPELTIDADASDATKEIKEVTTDAKAVDKLDPEVEVTADTSQATKAIEEVSDDTLALAKQDAKVLVEAEITKTEADLKDLKEKLQELDDMTVTPEVDSSKVRDFGDAAEGAKDSVSEFAGEAVTELPGVGEALGPASESIGQLVEGLASGKVGMTQLAAAALPIIAITAGMKAWADHTAKLKAESERVKNLTGDIAENLQEGATDAEALADALTAAGEVRLQLLDTFSIDIAPLLASAGVSVDQFSQLVAGGAEKIDLWAAKSKAAGINVDAIALAAHQAIPQLQSAHTQADILNTVFGGTADAAADAAGGVRDYAGELAAAKEVQDNLTAASDEYVASLNEQLDAMFGFADAGLAQTKAQEEFAAAARNTLAVEKEKGKASQEYADAVEAERDSLLGAAEAQVRMADELAKSQGKSLTATQKIDNYNKSLMDNAKYATPAARTAAYDYLIQLNQIPADKATVIQALVDQGRFDEANAIINETSKAREVAITADAHTEEAEAEIQKLIKARNLVINASIIAKGGAGYGGRTGDPEAGRTMVDAPVAAPAPSITVNMAPGARGVDVLRQISGQSRRSGRRYGTPVVHYARRGLP